MKHEEKIPTKAINVMRKKFKLMGASNIQIYSLNNGTDLFIKYIELE